MLTRFLRIFALAFLLAGGAGAAQPRGGPRSGRISLPGAARVPVGTPGSRVPRLDTPSPPARLPGAAIAPAQVSSDPSVPVKTPADAAREDYQPKPIEPLQAADGRTAKIPGVSPRFLEGVSGMEDVLEGREDASGDGLASELGSSLFENGAVHGSSDEPGVHAEEGPSRRGPRLGASGASSKGNDDRGPPLDKLVAATLSREFPGIFIQQEQEGSLIASDPRDSSGNVFSYYRPAQMRQALLDRVLAEMGAWEALEYRFRSLAHLFRRRTPERTWAALPVGSKLKYLALLESEVSREGGRQAAWERKRSLLLERRPEAPGYLARHPDMEAPPDGYGDHPSRAFLQPEIVTGKESPAATVREAVGRTKEIIADTGHAGTQYHVFVKMDPVRLKAGLPRLRWALQAVNDLLFLEAVQESPDNLLHPSLGPWHKGRSDRVAGLVARASPQPHDPEASDPDSEKHAFVGFRYWGMEGGRMVVSFELRGAGIPWKSKGPTASARGIEGAAPKAERDFAQVERYLSLLMHLAHRLGNGSLPAMPAPEIKLDPAAAERIVSRRAAQRKFPAGSLADLAALAGKMPGAVHPALLYPFAAGPAHGGSQAALEAYVDELLDFSARSRAGGERSARYMFWEAYREWSQRPLGLARRRFEALFRSAAR